MGRCLGSRLGRCSAALGCLLLALAAVLAAAQAADAAGWTVRSSGQPWLLGDVAVTDDAHAFALPMTMPAVLVDLGDGAQWATRTTLFPSATTIAAPDASHLWAAGGSGVYVSGDAGQSWQLSLQDATVELTSMSFSDATHGSVAGLAAGSAGDAAARSVVYTTSDGGQTWTAAHVTGRVRLLDVVGPGRSWALARVEGQDVVLRSDDGGATWTPRGAWGQAELLALAFGGDDAGAVSGTDAEGPFVATTADGGRHWTRRATAFALTALSFADPSSGWGIARGGAGPGADAVVGTGDGGARWTLQYSAAGELSAIDAAGPRVVAVGAAGVILDYSGPGPAASPDVDPPTVAARGYGGWHNHDVPVSISADDAASAVDFVQTRLDDGDVVTTAGADAQLNVAAPVDHTADGPHAVAFRAVDGAGNVAEWRSVTVSIDTLGPTTRAPYEVGVKYGGTALIPYAADDGDDGSGLGDVTIVVTTLSGQVVKRQAVAAPSDDAVYRARLNLGAGIGFYRYTVLARDAAGNEQQVAASSSLVVVRATVTKGFGARLVTGALLPYVNTGVLPKEDTGPHDALGVRMFESGGRLYDYPGGQARFGLANLNSYRITGDEFYLQRATAQATRLLQTRVVWSGAWYYPQRYSRDRHQAAGERMRPPWYSGMAQGQVISLFVRMYETTGDETYLQAAQLTMYSFAKPGPASGRPWTVTVDASAHLWIQEWPKVPLDYTFNGHMISSFGLYDYYRVTGDTLALLLFRSTASTALDYAARFRQPGWISSYCLRHGTPNAGYHEVHIDCLLQLYTLTGDTRFARFADLFRHDYPSPEVQGYVRISPGTHIGTRFDAEQRERASRKVTVTSPLTVTVVRRARQAGEIRLLTTTGPFAGYWLRERASHVYFLGKVAGVRYSPPRRVTLQAGRTYPGRQYGVDGTVTGELVATSPSTTSAHVSERAVVNGVDKVLVADGVWAGFWLPVKGLDLQ